MIFTSSSEEFKKFCDEIIQHADYVAIDTEFIRIDTYYPKLCLLQLAFKIQNTKKILILDVLSKEIEFQPFINVLKNKEITKVFHAGRQDCEIFLNLFNFLPQNIFDTQIGAMVCGIGDQESYENLVSNFLKIKIDKSFQFTDWSIRPLSKSKIEYAANDVNYLCDIYEHQKKLLKKLNRKEWIIEENNKLSEKETYHHNLISIYKKIRVNKSIKYKELIFDLIDFREKIAKKLNLPRNHIINDSKLVNIIKQLPSNINEIEKLSLFSKTELNNLYNKKIFMIVENFNLKKESNKNFVPKVINEKLFDIISLLKILLKITSNKYAVPSRLIASNQDLEDFILNQNENIPALKGWRWDVFGKDAMKLKNGEIAIYRSKNGLKLININS
ncbi:MAG: ribonuclease D [Paracoccaceae bacterium]